jgi:predicted CoA-binding protein
MTADERAVLGGILRSASTIAVVGMSPRPSRPSHYVAEYLQRAGYRVVPVRPGVDSILGEPAYPDLQAAARAAGPIDVVDVFRRSEAIPELAADLLAVRPRLVWMQVGVRHEDTAARLEAAGIMVVMDRCLMVDHPWLTGD